MRSHVGKLLPNPRRSELVLFATMLATGWLLLVLLLNTVTPAAIVLAGVAVTTAGQWSLLRRVSRQPVPLPGILIVAINVIGVTGYLWYPMIAARATVSAQMPDTAATYARAALIFFIVSASLWAGGMLGWSRSQAEATESFRDQARAALTSLNQVSTHWMLAVAAAPLGLMIIAYTPTGLWSREFYSQVPGPGWAIKLTGGLSTAGIALAAMLATRASGSSWGRRAARLLLVGYFITVWAMGSRSLAFIPLMLLIMNQVDARPDRSRTARISGVIFLTLSSLVLLQVPLSLRGRPEGAGIEPYWNILLTDPISLVGLDHMTGTFGNILFAVPLAASTSLMDHFPIHYLATSLNPLPGAYTDWDTIKVNLRVNAYTPTSAIGELANYGMFYLSGFFVILGWTLTRLQAWNVRLPAAKATLATIVGFGSCGSLALGMLQYNLRSGMRGLWYFLALSIVLHLLPRLRKINTDGAVSSPKEEHPADIG